MELSSDNIWDSLSADILLEICSKLTSIEDVVRLGECCRHYHNCTKGSTLWKTLYSRDYNMQAIDRQSDPELDWQALYLEQFRAELNMREGRFTPSALAVEVCDTVDRYGGSRVYPLTSASQNHALVTWATGPSFRTSYSVDVAIQVDLIDLTTQARTKIAEGSRGFCLVGDFVISAPWHNMYSYSGPNWNSTSIHCLEDVLQYAKAGRYDWWADPSRGHTLRIMSQEEANFAPWTRNWETALLVNRDPEYSHIFGLYPSSNSVDKSLPIGIWDLRNLSKGDAPEQLLLQRFLPNYSVALIGPLLLYTTVACELCVIDLLNKTPKPVVLLSNWAEIASAQAQSLLVHADSYCKATREIVVSLYLSSSVDDSDLVQRRLLVLRVPEPDTIHRWGSCKSSFLSVVREIVVADYVYTPDVSMLRVALTPNKIAFSGTHSYGVQLINVFVRKGVVDVAESSRPAGVPVEPEVLTEPAPMFSQLNVPVGILDKTKRLAEMCTFSAYSRHTFPLFYFKDEARLVSLAGDAVTFDWRPCQRVKVAILDESVDLGQVPWRMMQPNSIYTILAKKLRVSNTTSSFDIKATTVVATTDFRAILVYFIAPDDSHNRNSSVTEILTDHLSTYESERMWRNDPKDVKWVPTIYSPGSVDVIVDAANSQDTQNIPCKFTTACGPAYLFCEKLVDTVWAYADVPDHLVGGNDSVLFTLAPNQLPESVADVSLES